MIKNAFWRQACFLTFFIITLNCGCLWADQLYQAPLTQADIDAYVYLVPQLADKGFRDYDGSAKILRESGLSKKRAAYVGAKLALAQAMVEGLLTTDKMVEDNVPVYLQPSAEELRLVSDNLETIKKAQQAAASK